MPESPESDASLVGRARTGDATALDALLRRHVRASYLVALAQVGEHADAEDACQEAFMRCVEHLHECRSPERFGAWLAQIVRNTAHNRREHLRIRFGEPLASHPELRARVAADDETLRGELRATLLDALGKLPVVQREIVLLHDLEGLPHPEIAPRLAISVTMSRRHLSDARRTLRAMLGDYRTVRPDHD